MKQDTIVKVFKEAINAGVSTTSIVNALSNLVGPPNKKLEPHPCSDHKPLGSMMCRNTIRCVWYAEKRLTERYGG